MTLIPVYIVNLPNREDRRISIINQFRDKSLFNINIQKPIAHPIGSYSLWLTLRHIVAKCKEDNLPYFIFCEDDHIFTKHYSANILKEAITQAQTYRADILSGGVSWHSMPIQCNSNLFYLDSFNGLQFTVIFNNFYDSILNYKADESTISDITISNISSNIFVIWPFISVQKEFGYSDVTEGNNTPNYVSALFRHSEKELSILDKVKQYYNSIR